MYLADRGSWVKNVFPNGKSDLFLTKLSSPLNVLGYFPPQQSCGAVTLLLDNGI